MRGPARYWLQFDEERRAKNAAKDAAEFEELVSSMDRFDLLRLRLFMFWLSWRGRVRRWRDCSL